MGGRGRGIGALWWERGGRTGTLGRGKPRPLKWPAITDEAATLEGGHHTKEEEVDVILEEWTDSDTKFAN